MTRWRGLMHCGWCTPSTSTKVGGWLFDLLTPNRNRCLLAAVLQPAICTHTHTPPGSDQSKTSFTCQAFICM